MNRDGHNNVAFFIGPEVEHTPAYSKKTLFVVGKQDVSTIERLAREYKTPHIFMGANHSFDGSVDAYWDMTITALLDRGFWVTLDYEAHMHDKVLTMLNKGIWQSRLFVPLLGVRIPEVQTSSPNLTIKIDDVDFKATNEGVWCWNHQAITDANRFTDWQDYGTDFVLTEGQVIPTINPGPTGWTGPLEVKVAPQANTEVRSMRKPVNLEDLVDGEVLKKLADRDQEALKDPDVLAGFTEVKNDGNLGLDPAPTTALKPETEVEATVKSLDVIDAAATADAYAEGAKEDPLSKEASKKPVKAKK
jgi:hypothetical protein